MNEAQLRLTNFLNSEPYHQFSGTLYVNPLHITEYSIPRTYKYLHETGLPRTHSEGGTLLSVPSSLVFLHLPLQETSFAPRQGNRLHTREMRTGIWPPCPPSLACSHLCTITYPSRPALSCRFRLVQSSLPQSLRTRLARSLHALLSSSFPAVGASWASRELSVLHSLPFEIPTIVASPSNFTCLILQRLFAGVRCCSLASRWRRDGDAIRCDTMRDLSALGS